MHASLDMFISAIDTFAARIFRMQFSVNLANLVGESHKGALTSLSAQHFSTFELFSPFEMTFKFSFRKLSAQKEKF
jgi:hypothetical protein